MTIRHLTAGGIFAAIALFFLATSLLTLDTGTTLRMGPGFMPVLLSVLLLVLAIAVALERDPEQEAGARPVPWRGLLFITLAPLLFAVSIKGLGLAPALLVLIATSAFASRTMGIGQAVVMTAVMLGVAVGVFSHLLGLPYPLLGPWLSGGAG
ncbi:tripartite tricarboxylate transporter TctB family protein [Azospirillum sp. RWY-5-1]|uniref:Tripartite tricarboxylate transporter TctB family protein n=1 Tax=Azospirillum oleiclasticum TaxID=2735135 RepID=A0ABX2TJB1_9PROT|nr:tripartite tricarboxylate transporter TctB family protein [Azospirillum oleiclasticum]NYZ14538.1 tripartite tricarboxylate transporter TctB family protein [Azospirillum oleiclasticum]NYZ24316.1 tripartite tricarboxylate transporter TctB family protein [Azospirillum oleiclasticum]